MMAVAGVFILGLGIIGFVYVVVMAVALNRAFDAVERSRERQLEILRQWMEDEECRKTGTK